jgi:tetratricopeptide (TPR) repeat protein
MRKLALALFVALLCACAVQKVETSKEYYEKARQAQSEGKDLEAAVYWKAILAQADREIQAGHYLSTNYFLRASAYFELGEWEKGFADLQQIDPEGLRDEELWIYPLYAVLLGDYYSKQNMTSVAENFYQSVLKKSSFKSSPVYVLALERHVNNSIQAINLQTEKTEDGEKLRRKEYEDLMKEVNKYTEDYPFDSVSHFLLGDLLLKLGSPDASLEQFLASIELGLPTRDLLQSAEFEIVSLLSQYEVSAPLNSTLLAKAKQWWGSEGSSSFFKTGENTMDWLQRQQLIHKIPADANIAGATKVRYLGVESENRIKILTWERIE